MKQEYTNSVCPLNTEHCDYQRIYHSVSWHVVFSRVTDHSLDIGRRKQIPASDTHVGLLK